jgi:hypothetical protein
MTPSQSLGQEAPDQVMTVGQPSVLDRGNTQHEVLDLLVGLESLPAELIIEVCGSLENSDIRALRLTSRALSRKATSPTFKKRFRTGRVLLDEQGLTSFRAMTKDDGLGCLVDSLTIVGVIVAPKHRLSVFDIKARRIAKLENARLEEKALECRQFESSAIAESLLKECFENISRSGRGQRMRITITNAVFDVQHATSSYQKVAYDDRALSSVDIAGAFAFTTTMSVLQKSSLDVATLCISDPVPPSAFSGINWGEEVQAGIKQIGQLYLCLTTNVADSGGPKTTNKTQQGGKTVLALPDRRLTDIEDHAGLTHFLSIPSDLYSLTINYVKEDVRPSARPGISQSGLMMSSILKGESLSRVRTCSVENFEIHWEELLKFLALCSLRHLHLSGVNLIHVPDHEPDAGQGLLEYCRVSAVTLRYISYFNMLVNGNQDLSTWGEFERSSGPPDEFRRLRPGYLVCTGLM